MKINKQVEVTICDICTVNDAPYSACLRCGKAICYECKRGGHAVEMPHSMNCSGSDDGVYCSPCFATMETTPDPLFLAYKAIFNIRAESKSYYESLTSRAKVAEAEVKRLRKARGLR